MIISSLSQVSNFSSFRLCILEWLTEGGDPAPMIRTLSLVEASVLNPYLVTSGSVISEQKIQSYFFGFDDVIPDRKFFVS